MGSGVVLSDGRRLMGGAGEPLALPSLLDGFHRPGRIGAPWHQYADVDATQYPEIHSLPANEASGDLGRGAGMPDPDSGTWTTAAGTTGMWRTAPWDDVIVETLWRGDGGPNWVGPDHDSHAWEAAPALGIATDTLPVGLGAYPFTVPVGGGVHAQILGCGYVGWPLPEVDADFIMVAIAVVRLESELDELPHWIGIRRQGGALTGLSFDGVWLQMLGWDQGTMTTTGNVSSVALAEPHASSRRVGLQLDAHLADATDVVMSYGWRCREA